MNDPHMDPGQENIREDEDTSTEKTGGDVGRKGGKASGETSDEDIEFDPDFGTDFDDV